MSALRESAAAIGIENNSISSAVVRLIQGMSNGLRLNERSEHKFADVGYLLRVEYLFPGGHFRT